MARVITEKKPFEKVVRLIKGYGLNQKLVSEACGCDPRTAKKKLEDPRNLTLGDLLNISRKVHIPFDEIRECLII